MANTERGGTIREYIDARKKGGMTWDEFRKLKSEVDGPQFSENELIQYRQQLDDERDAKLKGLGSGGSSSKKKRKKHHHHHHHHHHRRRRHSSSHDHDHKKKRSKSEERSERLIGGSKSPIGSSEGEEGYYRSEDEKRDRRRIEDRGALTVEKEKPDKRPKRKEKNHSIESDAYESAADREDNDDKKRHHRHHHRHSRKKHKHKHGIQEEEEHTGNTPVRLSEFLKHGSSSSDE